MSWEGLNRRQFPRVSYPCLLKIVQEAKEPGAILTHTENISIGGACVIMKRSLELFSPLDVEVDLLDSEDHIKCHGKVVWVVRRKATEEKKPQAYDIGIEFLNIKDKDRARIEQAIAHLVQSAQKGRC